jgi:hypothetical protein
MTWLGCERCYQRLPLRARLIQVAPPPPSYALNHILSLLGGVVCMKEGWAVLIYTSMAVVGQWREAWEAVSQIDRSVYDSAGANGHSLTNTLWYIATRPDPEDL